MLKHILKIVIEEESREIFSEKLKTYVGPNSGWTANGLPRSINYDLLAQSLEQGINPFKINYFFCFAKSSSATDSHRRTERPYLISGLFNNFAKKYQKGYFLK